MLQCANVNLQINSHVLDIKVQPGDGYCSSDTEEPFSLCVFICTGYL